MSDGPSTSWANWAWQACGEGRLVEVSTVRLQLFGLTARAERAEAARDEAINQLDSARYSVEVLEKRVAKFMADNARLAAALTDAGPYLERGLDKMALNIIRAALKGETP